MAYPNPSMTAPRGFPRGAVAVILHSVPAPLPRTVGSLGACALCPFLLSL